MSGLLSILGKGKKKPAELVKSTLTHIQIIQSNDTTPVEEKALTKVQNTSQPPSMIRWFASPIVRFMSLACMRDGEGGRGQVWCIAVIPCLYSRIISTIVCCTLLCCVYVYSRIGPYVSMEGGFVASPSLPSSHPLPPSPPSFHFSLATYPFHSRSSTHCLLFHLW